MLRRITLLIPLLALLSLSGCIVFPAVAGTMTITTTTMADRVTTSIDNVRYSSGSRTFNQRTDKPYS